MPFENSIAKKRCGTCASYNMVKWPDDPICKKCSDVIPSWNHGCKDYAPLSEQSDAVNHRLLYHHPNKMEGSLMKMYKPSDYNTHTVRITLQCEEYVGHIAYRLGGNCRGFDVIEDPFETHTQEDIVRYPENDCKLRYREEDSSYIAILQNPAGDTLVIEGNEREMREYIVAMEIVSCEPDTNGN